MNRHIITGCIIIASFISGLQSCVPQQVSKTATPDLPARYAQEYDTTNSASQTWQQVFSDPFLQALIDTALLHNQELQIALQEIQLEQNEVLARKGEYLPFLHLRSGAGADKVGRFTRNGVLEANNELEPGREFPKPLGDFQAQLVTTWELDIWHKLRNARKAQYLRYLASVEGRNFMVTNLVSEIASAYYELLALDNQLLILHQNIEILNNALQIVKLQKEATRVTELAVRKFEAEVFSTKSISYRLRQRVVETENEINFLLGRTPQPIPRSSTIFSELTPQSLLAGVPSQLLQNRPDIRKAEKELEAASVNVAVARANFLPSFALSGTMGLHSVTAAHLATLPESLAFSLGGDLLAPLLNRNAIKAMYNNANARQSQAIYHYERAVLNAYVEVANLLSGIENLEKSYELRSQQVQALTQSIDLSNSLFRSARADYMEVLMTQRDALESKFDLIETRLDQFNVTIGLYKALGGGWKP